MSKRQAVTLLERYARASISFYIAQGLRSDWGKRYAERYRIDRCSRNKLRRELVRALTGGIR